MKGNCYTESRNIEIPADQIEQNANKRELFQRKIYHTQYLRWATAIAQKSTVMKSGEAILFGWVFFKTRAMQKLTKLFRL